MQFDTIRLASVLDELLNATIRYEMRGNVGKVRPLSKSVSQISQLDCSGFVEYVIYQGTSDNVNLPSGSWNQKDKIASDASHVTADYPTEAELRDDVVRIGFRRTIIAKDDDGKIVRTASGRPKKAQVGHVWLVINGRTYESTSRGGRSKGPKSLKWDARTSDADFFYKLGPAPGFGLAQLGILASQRVSALI